jgi:hypothetical protein
MIPSVEILTNEITQKKYPTQTYKIHINSNRVSGNIDGLDALYQTIYLILSSERYKHNIYSWDYGIELLDLIGQPMPLVKATLPRRIKEALLTDDRINDVTDFQFEQHGKRLNVTFTVVSNVGNLSTALEVVI